jgi:hypothetical protein
MKYDKMDKIKFFGNSFLIKKWWSSKSSLKLFIIKRMQKII